MVLVYNIIWIVLVLLLFLGFLTFLKRRSNRRVTQPQVTQITSTPVTGYPHATVIDMNRPPATTQPFTYRPPDESAIEPPPPAYKDHSKDYRVQG